MNIADLLKYCPKGTKLYSPIWGEVEFIEVASSNNIVIKSPDDNEVLFYCSGAYHRNGECVLFPSKDQRDWSKFTAPWYKKDRFDPKTLKAFEKVLARNTRDTWRCAIFSHIDDRYFYPYIVSGACFKYCIPYNDDTKHLVGTEEEAPEYYRYWEE